MSHKEWKFKALTDLWTGDAQGKPDRTITTGLLGSIRWWFEVMVRGLGGKACDPTLDGNRCPDGRKQPTDAGHHCVVCELFGCTGWARKFRFEVLDASGAVKVSQIKKGDQFTLRFTELRPIRAEEWALLGLTLCLIADYGAIGGKTVYKPSEETSRQNAPHHRDYGLIRLEQKPDLPTIHGDAQAALGNYVKQTRWRSPDQDNFSWASLQNFWCVKGRYLARQNENASTFNRVIGRPEPKNQSQGGDSWLAGRKAGQKQPAESKKVFSFKEPESARRTFGFVESTTQLHTIGETLQRQLGAEWSGFDPNSVKTGEDILKEVMSARQEVQ